MGVKKTQQKTFYKKIVSKSFYKKIDQKTKTDFFSIFFITFLGRFSVRGVQKHEKNNGKKSDPSAFLASAPPPATGAPSFFFGGWGPLVNCKLARWSGMGTMHFIRHPAAWIRMDTAHCTSHIVHVSCELLWHLVLASCFLLPLHRALGIVPGTRDAYDMQYAVSNI